jgi:hypothetical protein
MSEVASEIMTQVNILIVPKKEPFFFYFRFPFLPFFSSSHPFLSLVLSLSLLLFFFSRLSSIDNGVSADG